MIVSMVMRIKVRIVKVMMIMRVLKVRVTFDCVSVDLCGRGRGWLAVILVHAM